MITLSERSTPGRFASLHFLGVPLTNNRFMIIRSGVARVGLDGTTSDDWLREELRLYLDLRNAIRRIQPRQPGEGLSWAMRVEQWAPIAGLNAIFDAATSINAGYAVDTFGLAVQDSPTTFVRLNADLAVRDSDARIIRVGYHVTLVGRLEEIDAQGIE